MHRAGIFDISNNIIPDNKFSHGEPYVGQSYLDYMKNKNQEYTSTFDELIGVNDSRNPLLKTYSGLLAVSEVPEGETVKVNVPLFSRS